MVMLSKDNPNWTGPKLFAYLRYDPDVTPPADLRELGLGDIDATVVQVMDSVEHTADIQRVGSTCAAKSVVIEPFKGFVQSV